MEGKRTNYKDAIRILCTFLFLFQGTAELELQKTTAFPVGPTTLRDIHISTGYLTNNGTTDSANALNTTSNATYPPSYTSPNSSDSTTPSQPQCLQGWAIFLLCLAAIVTVFLLAGIPMLLYCLLHSRHLQHQQCPHYNRQVYVAPEEQNLPLE